jgi:Leucine rich repeat/BspA type Leucine rich repeat region (6 copies)
LSFIQHGHRRNNRIAGFFKSEQPETLRVECYSGESLDYSQIPQINFSEVTRLEVKCPLAGNSVLTRIKQDLNLTMVKVLKVESTSFPDEARLSGKLFEGFNHLEELHLESNEFKSFHENIFESLSHVKTMKLRVHDVISLPFNVFSPLMKMESLSIENYGRLKNDPKTLNFTLKPCINLENFHLSGVRWPIAVNKLVNDRSFKKVEIINNRIESLSHETFAKAEEILLLNLTNDNLKHLSADAFTTQCDLIKIDLSHNLLENLHENLFAANEDLVSINLSHNRLTSTHW